MITRSVESSFARRLRAAGLEDCAAAVLMNSGDAVAASAVAFRKERRSMWEEVVGPFSIDNSSRYMRRVIAEFTNDGKNQKHRGHAVQMFHPVSWNAFR